jgi:glyoxylase-like metal-dependent hydrolase (beta-lactamase superfamily II)
MFSRRDVIASAIAMPLTAAMAERSFAATPGEPGALELALPGMERLAYNVWVKQAADDLWITSFTGLLGGTTWYPANGMIVRGADGLTFIDPGWDRSSGEVLLKYAREKIGGPIARAIATHFHEDRVAGLGAMRRAGIPALGSPLTAALARAFGTTEPDPIAALATGNATLGPVELFFPGVGHTRDNIVAWHKPTATLFGGCLLKATTAPDMGNLEDGDIRAYPATLAALQARYPARRMTIPGHGTVAGDALAHSQALVAQALKTAGRS